MSSSQISRSAGRMGIGVFLSRIFGLVREQVFAYLFGASMAMDAFNVAFRIPNLLRDLFAEGAMSSALVPTFVKVRTEEGDRRAWRVAGLVFRVLTLIVGAICVLGILFSSDLVRIYAGSFQNIPGKFELTVNLTRILFVFFPLVALAAAFMAILNSCGRFFLPAFASALFNVSSVLTGVLFYFLAKKFSFEPIYGMALGVVVGGATQAFCQLPEIYRAGYRFPPKEKSDPVWYRDPALKAMLFLILPGTLGLAATQINILVNTILATSQEPGAVSWLNYAFRLMQFPIGIFGVSMGVATLPRIAELLAKKQQAKVSATLEESIKGVFTLNLPAAAGLAFLAGPLIQMIFEYGRFHSTDTHQTARALAFYALGLPFYSVVKVLVPACYALGKVRLAVLSSVGSVIVNILLNLVMVGPMGFTGLALGTSVTSVLNSVILWVGISSVLRENGAGLRHFEILWFSIKLLLASLAMGFAVYFLQDLWPSPVAGDGLLSTGALVVGRVLRVSISIGIAIGIYVGFCHLLKLREATELLTSWAVRLKKKLSGSKSLG